ncbi:hypothetical protein [Cupriavidus sp. SW-Y-13]|uniref:hypothetical protein n=1 Tax=Cupriavidus sp. SW-Y-13 TaxID=2653854 RepID=UPI0013663C2B|nr:hypothetical protein [Cupriavidus sp. SW-Y-13]MWL90510.1 hypothetical protein [Cupriavidus sp. SW-Y-13]
MSYITVTMNHLRAVKAWLDRHGGTATINVQTFELEIKTRNRYFSLYPQFLAVMSGRVCYVPAMTEDVTGFIGWLPYRPLRWSISTDKLLFKECMREQGIATPAIWDATAPAAGDHVLKSSRGSFGYDLSGPYRVNQAQPAMPPGQPGGQVFREAFVAGRNLKAWFWGDTPFHAHLHDYPEIEGDGHRTVAVLLAERFASVGLSVETWAEMEAVYAALAFQQVDRHTVLENGRRVFIDFRYGRLFANEDRFNRIDNNLPAMDAPLVDQLQAAGQVVAARLRQEFPGPVLYSLDGVVDAAGKVWWLEMNSNPTFPPTGYPHLLGTLFGTAADEAASSQAMPAPATAAPAESLMPVPAVNPSVNLQAIAA